MACTPLMPASVYTPQKLPSNNKIFFSSYWRLGSHITPMKWKYVGYVAYSTDNRWTLTCNECQPCDGKRKKTLLKYSCDDTASRQCDNASKRPQEMVQWVGVHITLWMEKASKKLNVPVSLAVIAFNSSKYLKHMLLSAWAEWQVF